VHAKNNRTGKIEQGLKKGDILKTNDKNLNSGLREVVFYVNSHPLFILLIQQVKAKNIPEWSMMLVF